MQNRLLLRLAPAGAILVAIVAPVALTAAPASATSYVTTTTVPVIGPGATTTTTTTGGGGGGSTPTTVTTGGGGGGGSSTPTTVTPTGSTPTTVTSPAEHSNSDRPTTPGPAPSTTVAQLPKVSPTQRSIWLDLNGNGRRDDGESGISGVEVTATSHGKVIARTTTDADGHYDLGNLPRDAVVRVVGALQGLSPTTTKFKGDIGFRGKGRICATTWTDRNRDGRRQRSEKAKAGVPVLFAGPNGLVATATSNRSGLACLTGLTDGTWQVRPTGGAKDVAARSVTVKGKTDKTLSFGLIRDTSAMSSGEMSSVLVLGVVLLLAALAVFGGFPRRSRESRS